MRTLNTFILSLQDPSTFPAPDPLHVVAAHPDGFTLATHSERRRATLAASRGN